ncbi:hypothetical protein G7072_00380 [Nocardioides sp. HDW12B]|uniref:PxKF domain-containing protein n=1 Tax=Nocardioides sp. HDW12B TaxID=2714939 RepID=UPI00140A046E|nr:PxKF domain-containing protein [Nocardioides sp. HDW12B]QIK64995.1 hypothetical protein G7072_00380 [Nocardioides sp. HDW12B]
MATDRPQAFCGGVARAGGRPPVSLTGVPMKNRLIALILIVSSSLLLLGPPAHAAGPVTVDGTVTWIGGPLDSGSISLVEYTEFGIEPTGVGAQLSASGEFRFAADPGWHLARVNLSFPGDPEGFPNRAEFLASLWVESGRSPVIEAPMESFTVSLGGSAEQPVSGSATVACEQGSYTDNGYVLEVSSSWTVSGSTPLTLYVAITDWADCRVGATSDDGVRSRFRHFSMEPGDTVPNEISFDLASRLVSGTVDFPFGAIDSGTVSVTNSEGSLASTDIDTATGAFSLRAPVGAGSISASARGSNTRMDLERTIPGDAENVTLSVDTVPLQVYVVDPAGDGSIPIEMECSRFSGANREGLAHTAVGPDVTLEALPNATYCRVRFPDPDVWRTSRPVTVGPDGGDVTYFTDTEALIHGDPDAAVDADGVDAQVEALGPESGDGNRDGVFDYLQDHVTTLPINGEDPNPRDPSSFLTVVGPDESTLLDVSTLDLADVAEPPEGVFLPAGLVSFTVADIPVGSTQTISLHKSAVPRVSDYAKYDPDTRTWSLLPRDRVAFVEDHLVVRLTDGGIGDADGEANGRIVDPGGPAQVTTPRDTTPPEVTGTATSEPNASGWYDDDVTVAWTATDDQSDVSDPPDTVLTGEGGDLSTTSEEVCDQADNCATGTVEGIDIDRTPPVVTLTGRASGATYVVGGVPLLACTASDVLSGLTGPCTTSTTGGRSNGTGSFTSTATATDRAGNTAQATADYDVVYRFDGFGQPINDPRTSPTAPLSVFRAGDTVPVSFVLRRADGTVITPADAPRWVTPERRNPTTARVNESVPSAPGTTGSAFLRKKDRWQFDWSTKKLAAGYEYRIGARLDDGTTRYVTVALR